MAAVDEVAHLVQVGIQRITHQAVEDLQFVYLALQPIWLLQLAAAELLMVNVSWWWWHIG
jgi:hypothetical protein